MDVKKSKHKHRFHVFLIHSREYRKLKKHSQELNQFILINFNSLKANQTSLYRPLYNKQLAQHSSIFKLAYKHIQNNTYSCTVQTNPL